MHSVEKDTLAYQLKSRPGTLYRDMSNVPTHKVAAALNDYMNSNPGTEQPENEAIWFYMTNHAVAELRNLFDMEHPLGECFGLVDDYQTMLSQKSVRMFYYLLMITTREARHLHSCSTKNQLASKYGDSFANFQDELSGKGSDGAAKYIRTNPPDCDIGTYADALVDIFNNGKFSGGFGGKPWGEVAHCMREFVHGRYSAEMMMDTAFTLCHNNGPIFNKGMLYDMYNKGEIVKILDVQRSGQIPQLVEDGSSGYVTSSHKGWQNQAKLLLGDQFGGYVDWFLVEELGAMQSYQSQKNNQKAVHGLPVNEAKKAAELEKKKLQAEMMEAKKKAEEEANWFTVMPGLKVKKIQVRKVKAA